MSRIAFNQRTSKQIRPLSSPTIEAEIGIGDLTLGVHRFTRSSQYVGESGSKEKLISVSVSTFTDNIKTWRKLDELGVFQKIEKAELRDSDDLARLLVKCGLRHVPYAGSQYDVDGGAGEKARIKALHAEDPS